jgi:hypothetical protein
LNASGLLQGVVAHLEGVRVVRRTKKTGITGHHMNYYHVLVIAISVCELEF